jgi:hypothetical protein
MKNPTGWNLWGFHRETLHCRFQLQCSMVLIVSGLKRPLLSASELSFRGLPERYNKLTPDASGGTRVNT